jgi:hypothetical protein
MKHPRLVALAAALSATVAIPALAQNFGFNNPQQNNQTWDRIGSVDFTNRPEQEVEYNRFGGRMTRLSFRAANSDVMCRDVSATFNNGRSRTIYSGTLPFNQDVVVDLPGAERRVESIYFDCRSTAPRGSRVDIAADIGEYRAEWRQSPDWLTVWSRVFNWPDQVGGNFPGRGGRGPGPGWVPLSTERFEGPRDRETTLPGARGRSIETVGIRPLDNEATCMRVSATFENGRTSDLYVNRGARLLRNRMYEVDLPGAQRNLARLDMMCRGDRGRPVTIQVFGNR